jgi:DNA-binding response OmpR family regulator
MRRSASRTPPAPATSHALAVGPFELNPVTHTVTKNGHPIDLAPREFDLLKLFLTYPERAFTSNELVDGVWGVEYQGETQVLYVQVRSLREKIEADPSRPRHILTLRGIGYKFMP